MEYRHIGAHARGGRRLPWAPPKLNGFARIEARRGRTVLGVLDLHDDGEIAWIGVDPRYLRTGIGTGMVAHAVALGLRPRHSTHLSGPASAGFAAGTPLPEQ